MDSRRLAFAALLLFLTWSPAGADECAIRRAEATVCPRFEPIDAVGDLSLSGDGRVAVGSVLSGGPFVTRAMRWVEGKMRDIPGLEDFQNSGATAVSRDGSVITGFAYFDRPPDRAGTFRWEAGVAELIDTGFFPWVPTGISGNGQVIALFRDSGPNGGRWTRERGIEIWDAPSVRLGPWPSGISDAGDRIVGSSVEPFDFQAFEWRDDVTVPLSVPALLAQIGYNFVEGISPEGAVAVGATANCDDVICMPGFAGAVWVDGVYERRPFSLDDATWEGRFLLGRAPAGPALLDDANGRVLALDDVLRALGVSAPTITKVTEMSYDGHALVGLAGGTRYWAVIAPKLGLDVEPGSRGNRIDLSKRRKITVRVYGSEQADASQIDPFDLRFGPGRAVPVAAKAPRDRNGDGWLDRDYRFDPADVELALGDREACLSGVANGLPFRVCSEVRTHFGAGSEAR